eukprot:10165891-Alexandrium_andersonii.AAC.1
MISTGAGTTVFVTLVKLPLMSMLKSTLVCSGALLDLSSGDMHNCNNRQPRGDACTLLSMSEAP